MLVFFSVQQGTKLHCNTPVDLGFVMDSSGSLQSEYHKEKQFVKAIADAFNVGDIGSRAGVVTFSHQAEHSIKLNDNIDIFSFREAVNAIPHMGYTTRIDRGLRMAQSEIFLSANGGREGVPKVLVLLTDGSQTPSHGAEDPSVISKELRESGVKLIVIGVGKGVNSTELLKIAGSDDKVYTADSFDELIRGDFIDKITAASCSGKSLLLIINVLYFEIIMF